MAGQRDERRSDRENPLSLLLIRLHKFVPGHVHLHEIGQKSKQRLKNQAALQPNSIQ